MSARLGDTVIVVGVHSSNGATHPAIVTQVFEPKSSDFGIDKRVNLTVFPDGLLPALRQSIPCYRSLADANAKKAVMPFCYPRL